MIGWKAWRLEGRNAKKRQAAISYADCFTVATAQLFSGSILTGDPEFQKVEYLVAVDWI